MRTLLTLALLAGLGGCKEAAQSPVEKRVPQPSQPSGPPSAAPPPVGTPAGDGGAIVPGTGPTGSAPAPARDLGAAKAPAQRAKPGK